MNPTPRVLRSIALLVAVLIAATALPLSGVALSSVSAAYPNCTSASRISNWNSRSEYTYLPTTSSGSINCVAGTWMVGSFNSGVFYLQRTIAKCYGYMTASQADGKFGPITKAALIRVQKREGVTADGIYGPETQAAMMWRDFIQPREGTAFENGACVEGRFFA